MSEQPDYTKCSCENCGGHLEYPVDLAGSSIDCPHCHFSTLLPGASKSKSKSFSNSPGLVACLTIFALIGVIALATWQFHLKSESSATPITALPPPTNHAVVAAPEPVLREWNGFRSGPVMLEKAGEGSLVYALGMLTNTSDQQKFGVKVHIDLFDNSGSKIGSATDYANSIDAGKAWQFRAMVVNRGAVKAELMDVTQD